MKKGIIIREKCPVCRSISSKTIFLRRFNEELIKEYMMEAYQGNADIRFLEDVLFEIVKCDDCNLSYQKYVLDDELLKVLYDKWIDPKLAKDWYERGKTKRKSRYFSFILNFVKRQLKKECSKIKILDYGAGFGDFLVVAKAMEFDSYAYEFSNKRIDYLKRKGIKIIDERTEILFDFILVNQVLEHLTYPKESLKFISSKLKKDGIIFVSVPNCNKIEKKIKATKLITDAKQFHRILLDASVGAFQHINFFSNYNLKQLLKSIGLKPISPFRQIFVEPSIKSLIRPFYKYKFGTAFFAEKKQYH
jgi:2-polyprenyl-3-methyl-5-hydroxy-6-metoxy-1,4-benzoquinol methylase